MWSRLFKSEKQINLDMKLHHSLRKDALLEVEIHIASGADLASTVDGLTPIERAAAAQEWEVVELIASKVKNPSNDYQFAAVLEEAIGQNQELAAISLITAGTDLNQDVFDNHLKSILHFAIEKKNPRIIELLIKKSPNLLKTDYSFLHAPLGHAADRADRSMRNDNTKMEAQEFWNIVQLMIPYAKAEMDKEIWPMYWNRIYGFEPALAFAAKHGNAEIVRSLHNVGISLDISSFNLSSKSVLDKSAKYNQFNTAALSLYSQPNLEMRNRLGSNYTKWQNPADINLNLVKDSTAWAGHFRIFIEKCTLLLNLISSPESVSFCPKELYPQIFMNLILLCAMDKKNDLRFNTDLTTIYQDRFNVHLTERKIADSVAKILWKHKVLRMINTDEPNPSNELVVFIKGLSELHDDNAIKACITEFAQPDKPESNRDFLRKYQYEFFSRISSKHAPSPTATPPAEAIPMFN